MLTLCHLLATRAFSLVTDASCQVGCWNSEYSCLFSKFAGACFFFDAKTMEFAGTSHATTSGRIWRCKDCDAAGPCSGVKALCWGRVTTGEVTHRVLSGELQRQSPPAKNHHSASSTNCCSSLIVHFIKNIRLCLRSRSRLSDFSVSSFAPHLPIPLLLHTACLTLADPCPLDFDSSTFSSNSILALPRSTILTHPH